MRDATDDCVFCGILAGALPVSWVHRDERVVAFMDIRPVNPGHLLVVPRAHAPGLADVEPETAGHMMRVGQRLAAGLRASGLRCEGVDLFLADGVAAGQEVLHAHLHVIPRFRGDGFGMPLGPHTRALPSRAELDTGAARIAAAADPERGRTRV